MRPVTLGIESQRGHGSRDRVTIELRGMRKQLHALAVARNMTSAALARKVLAALLDGERSAVDSNRNVSATTGEGKIAKVTLRTPLHWSPSPARQVFRKALTSLVSSTERRQTRYRRITLTQSLRWSVPPIS